jgi:hypothetical protein
MKIDKAPQVDRGFFINFSGRVTLIQITLPTFTPGYMRKIFYLLSMVLFVSCVSSSGKLGSTPAKDLIESTPPSTVSRHTLANEQTTNLEATDHRIVSTKKRKSLGNKAMPNGERGTNRVHNAHEAEIPFDFDHLTFGTIPVDFF